MSTSTQSEYITLQEWAVLTFASMPPAYLLRRMARAGRIQPPPVLIGRSYWVLPSANFVGPVPEEFWPKVRHRGQRTALYRHFDAAGRLLYVGISWSVLVRMMTHEREARWFDQVATITVAHFEDRVQALAAEARAIEQEKPVYNIAGKPQWELAAPPPDDAAEMAKLESWLAGRDAS